MSKLPKLARFDNLKKIISTNYLQAKLRYLQKIWLRLVDRNYPSSYLCLFENKEELEIVHLKNGETIKQRSFLLTDLEWKKYLKKHHDLPVYIVAKRLEHNFKTLPLDKLKFWERVLMVRKIRNYDSDNSDLMDCYQILNSQKKFYALVSAKSSESLQNIYREFATLPNVLAGVRSFELEIVKKMLASAALEHNLHDLTICVIEQSAKEFTLIVTDSNQLILQRHVCCSEKDIEAELKATAKFLTSFGYSDDHSISVLIPENIFKNIKCLQSNIEFLPIALKIFAKENYSPAKAFLNFVPKCLQQSYYGYLLPVVAVRYLVPAFIMCMVISLGIHISWFYQAADAQLLSGRYEDVVLQIPEDIEKQIYLHQQFQKYIKAIAANPSWRISKINKNLSRAQLPASLVSWQLIQGQRENFEILLKFPTISPKKLQSLCKVFDKECEKNLGLVETNWLDSDKEVTLAIRSKNANAA